MFDRKHLFYLLRNAPFGGKLSTMQVKAVGLILDLCEKLALPLPFIAYIIATAFHETGGTFNPGKESLNYSASALKSKFSRERISIADAEKYGRKASQKANQSAIANLIYGGAWGLRNLGNKVFGDGWRYIGRGLVQLTGRRNYDIYGIADNPEEAMKLEKAVSILVDGMINGRFTGKHLANYFKGGVFNPVAARAVVNGSDKASLIAMHYEAILAALEKAEIKVQDFQDVKAVVADAKDVSEVKTDDVEAAKSPVAVGTYATTVATFLGGIVAAITTPWGAAFAIAALVIGALFLYGHMSGKLEFKR